LLANVAVMTIQRNHGRGQQLDQQHDPNLSIERACAKRPSGLAATSCMSLRTPAGCGAYC
jgi:hypothetical protein